MRVILDTNILVSALIVPSGPPGLLDRYWRDGRFVLISSEDQLEEFRRVTRYPRLRKWFQPAAAGTMLNEIRGLAETRGSAGRKPSAAVQFALHRALAAEC